MNHYYAGVGNRKTPPDILSLMTRIATHLDSLGKVLRSGGAKGADDAFLQGTSLPAQLYLPYQGFNGHQGIVIEDQEILLRATEIAARIHGNWAACDDFARKTHLRSVFQILGGDLKSPSDFLIFWAPTDRNGNIEGGTRTAVALAQEHSMPSYNLANIQVRGKFRERLMEIQNSLSINEEVTATLGD
jgi:hypothetical protein